jgi:hypothetical protein
VCTPQNVATDASTRASPSRQAVQQPAAAGRAIALIAYPADADFGHLRDDREGKFIAAQ